MALDLKQHPTTSSPSASSPVVKIKSESPDDYINDVPQDLRCRSNGGTNSSKEKQSEQDLRAKDLSATAVDFEDHDDVEEDEEASDTRHPNGGDHVGEQGSQDGPEDDSVYDRTAMQTSVHSGEGAMTSMSRDEAMEEGSKFSSAPGTPDCNNLKSEDMLVSSNEDFQPCRDREGNLILDVDCGSNSGFLYINKLCQGSKGQSIYFSGKWYTPNEFQYISGRETAKDWKRSIRHRGKSLKILMSKGLLSVHTSAASECSNCKMNLAMSRVRYSDKKPALPSNSLLQASPSSTTMTTIDKANRRSVGETDSSSLNHIINQLHQTNGFSSSSIDSSRKRALLLEMANQNKRSRSLSPVEDDIYIEEQRRIFQAANSPEPQMIENVRRSLNISTGGSISGPPSPASLSPPSLEDQVNGIPDGDFILRSPQALSKHQNKSSRKQISPQHIDLTTAEREVRYENLDLGLRLPSLEDQMNGIPDGDFILRSSQALSKHSNKSSHKQISPQHIDLTTAEREVRYENLDLGLRLPSLEDQMNGVPEGDFILRSPQALSKHPNKSSRKQISPQHIDLTTAERESANRSPHLMFSSTTTGSGNSPYHKQAVMRQRYHSQAYNLSRNSSSSITTNETSSRRTQSLLTPTTKSSETPMIELTRPDLVAPNGSSSSVSDGPSRTSGVTSTSHVAEDGTSRRLSANDVFFPSDMSSWTVDDVVQFVQSLKGCEEYAQLFRDQAIDGEILPVLTEDHLLQTMGMKLGPALKIRLHIAKRLGFTLNGQYCTLKTPYEEVREVH